MTTLPKTKKKRASKPKRKKAAISAKFERAVAAYNASAKYALELLASVHATITDLHKRIPPASPTHAQRIPWGFGGYVLEARAGHRFEGVAMGSTARLFIPVRLLMTCPDGSGCVVESITVDGEEQLSSASAGGVPIELWGTGSSHDHDDDSFPRMAMGAKVAIQVFNQTDSPKFVNVTLSGRLETDPEHIERLHQELANERRKSHRSAPLICEEEITRDPTQGV